jgi:hypothetical protein
MDASVTQRRWTGVRVDARLDKGNDGVLNLDNRISVVGMHQHHVSIARTSVIS